MRGHELHVGDAVVLDGGQHRAGVEARPSPPRAAQALRADRPAGGAAWYSGAGDR